MAKVETGINWAAVRRDLNHTAWETAEDRREERFSFLGTCFALTPSGKYYQPFACSNVDACETCGGKGTIGKIHRKRRIASKWQHALDTFRATHIPGQRCSDQRYVGFAFRKINIDRRCPACGSCGSREAHLDELWHEQLETEASEHGLWITSGEGDPCDILAGESRDIAEDDDED